MKVIKWILIVVVALAAILVGGGYLLSPKFTVTRSTSIQAPPEAVYALVAAPKEWKRWSVWTARDPAMAIEYSGPESGAGATWRWTSKSQGDGTMRFTAAEASKRVAYDLYFPDFGTTSTGELRFEPEGPNGAGTKVTWIMNGDMGSNPLFRWIGLNADSMVGKDFEGGLAGLKKVAETK